jgi:hypothetical protein
MHEAVLRSALFIQVLPGLEAVVEVAEEAAEQVALGGVVPVFNGRPVGPG